MKLIKTILLIIVTITGILLIIPLFVNGNYSCQREVTINKNKTEVFEFVKQLKNQNLYSKWATMDPNMKKIFTGTDGEVGFISRWESEVKEVGVGEQEITNIIEDQRIDTELRFIEPFESTDLGYMITEAINDSTTLVKWGINGKMRYPTNIMLITMDIEEMLGNDLQEGLDKLKTIMEEN